jgi:hypothetical protein
MTSKINTAIFAIAMFAVTTLPASAAVPDRHSGAGILIHIVSLAILGGIIRVVWGFISDKSKKQQD